MSADIDALRDIYRSVTDRETVSEPRREEDVSHAPLEDEEASIERTVAAVASEDGLGDAIADSDVETDA